MDAAINQIELRLGDSDPIILSQRKLVKVAHNFWAIAKTGDIEAFKKLMTDGNRHYREFVQAAKNRIGSQLQV